MKHLKLYENFNQYTELANRIDLFIDKYAGISPNYDPEYDDLDEKYTSPDAYEMLRCSITLKDNKIPHYCHSQWSSGGYKPYTSIEGRLEHDDIMKELSKL